MVFNLFSCLCRNRKSVWYSVWVKNKQTTTAKINKSKQPNQPTPFLCQVLSIHIFFSNALIFIWWCTDKINTPRNSRDFCSHYWEAKLSPLSGASPQHGSPVLQSYRTPAPVQPPAPAEMEALCCLSWGQNSKNTSQKMPPRLVLGGSLSNHVKNNTCPHPHMEQSVFTFQGCKS